MAVSIAVLQPAKQSSSGREAKDYWENTFRRSLQESSADEGGQREEAEARNKRKGEEEEEKEEKAKNPLKKIEGVGDEAYWSGTRFGGALYVLRKNVILRISVGGPDDQETKIQKSKELGQKAITRL